MSPDGRSRYVRIVHLASGDRFAGAEAATVHLLRGLAARDEFELRLVCLNGGELATRVADAGIDTRVEPEAGRSFAALGRALAPHLADADLIHAHRYKEDLLALRSGRPWVATRHGRPEPFHGAAGLRMAVYTALDLLAMRRARRVVAVSREVERWLAPRVGRTRVTRIWNGVADPSPGQPPPPWRDRPRRVGMVARLDPVKDVGFAIEAVGHAPGVELEIVGDGPERARLEAQAAASGAGDRIRFLGFQPDPLPYARRWRALLLTSRHEGNPIAVLEALAVGTPILATDLPGVAEILEGRGGWIRGARHAASWGRALTRVVDDGVGGEAASRAARERYLAAFSAERAAERMAGLYREVLT